MGKNKSFLNNNKPYGTPFTSPNFRMKHASSQVNGETMETQKTIILHHQIRKNS